MRIHTAHLSIGKTIPLNSNVVVIDTTVKSASCQLGRALAPTWTMVLGYKDKSVSEELYSQQYGDILSNVSHDLLSAFKRAEFDKKVTDVVVTCYCGKGVFCHRHLTARWLSQTLGLEFGWEITSADVEITKKPNGSVFSVISESVYPLDKIRECLSEYIENGTVAIVDNKDPFVGESRVGAITKFTRVLHGYGDATVIDITGLLDTMYELDNLSLDREGAIDSITTGFIRNPLVWGTVSPVDVSDLVSTIENVGFTDHVTLSRSYFNDGHATMMDTLYKEQVVK